MQVELAGLGSSRSQGMQAEVWSGKWSTELGLHLEVWTRKWNAKRVHSDLS